MAVAVAHRGDPYHHRENTLPSLRSALRAGADAVEIDVRLTRDGVPVLLHDPTLRRLWGHRTAVADLTSDRLRRLTADGVPTLHDALTAVAEHGTGRALLDLTAEDQAGPTVAAVRDAGAESRAYYCGEFTAMFAVRRYDPAAEIALTWKTSVLPPAELLTAVQPRWINLQFGLVSPPLVRWARERDLLVAAWTADMRRTMARLLGMGVDSVTTNRLDVLRELLDDR
ncbi:glycerophosphodiester phosphodiesterase [Streptomyces sp. H10-C2]|uniref:glycerophosphodiester phosphodiesterase n=1 Tax=unclassified Streptomyces TaxID=2593676 RepID=UPI0024BA7EFB|nr:MULTISPECIES: glycerophosphodiester phosphodiesterase [unclassified Streptomyces]MDJ0343325.1 glycerophosphodiester phosphodiesterase [Streptomyces sp. PH10-H1]MDJ0372890.1 glycerophosphodiester phosphodiesterase [Streptomyces sp. H10-C2]